MARSAPASTLPRDWPASNPETRQVKSLTPSARNARTHTPAQVAKIAAAIKQWGWTNPVLVDEAGGIIAGHGRILAAALLGIEAVPVIVARGWTDAQKRAYLIADNQIALDSGWDRELLSAEMIELKALDFDLKLIGFDAPDLEGLMSGPINLAQDIDDVPLPPDDATTRPGDLWVIGKQKHRLLCGDSSNAEHVARLCDGNPIHLFNSDPPYNVKVEPRSNNAIAAGNSSFAPQKQSHHQKMDLARHPEKGKRTTTQMRAKDRPLANDFITDEDFAAILRKWFNNASHHLVEGRAFYIWGGYANCANYPSAMLEAGFYFSQALIWVKEHPVLTRKDFMGNHEWCFYGWKEGAAHKWYGPNNVPDVWPVKKLNHTSMVHLTEKPVELAVRAMQYSTLRNENVLDLFGGSGSTMAGAHEAERRAFLMEIDMPYADVIVNRMQKLTGIAAVLEGDGRTFEQVKAERENERLAGVARESKGKKKKAVAAE